MEASHVAHRVTEPGERAWWRTLTRYQWLVFAVASCGWMFDCMDQQIFFLSRAPALKELLAFPEGTPDQVIDAAIAEQGGFATMIFLIGWAAGGGFFGVMGDRLGRTRTMVLTILVYSAFTGLSAVSWNIWSFDAFRFFTGFGGGGQFAVCVALVAEVMPERARPHALGSLQASAMIGTTLAALLGIGMGQLKAVGLVASAWRPMFLVGMLPAVLALVVMRFLREPERWSAIGKTGQAKLGSLRELFGDARLRRHTIIGMLMAFAGVVGLWGIAFFSFDLIFLTFRKTFVAQGLNRDEIAGKLQLWMGIASVLQNLGGFCGVFAFIRLTQRIGRKPAFALSFVSALLSTALVFWFLQGFSDIFWMIPLMGFCQMALFAGYAIYLPELFPTRLRSTGTSFCYNVGRLFAAAGPLTLGLLTSQVYAHLPEPMRYAGVTMCAVFLVGLLALPFAPETKGQPLPD
jgi:MFS family permease